MYTMIAQMKSSLFHTSNLATLEVHDIHKERH